MKSLMTIFIGLMFIHKDKKIMNFFLFKPQKKLNVKQEKHSKCMIS
jgi:uncharacterized membrane protein (UPF0127 family)